jgi:hypothetical protein
MYVAMPETEEEEEEEEEEKVVAERLVFTNARLGSFSSFISQDSRIGGAIARRPRRDRGRVSSAATAEAAASFDGGIFLCFE